MWDGVQRPNEREIGNFNRFDTSHEGSALTHRVSAIVTSSTLMAVRAMVCVSINPINAGGVESNFQAGRGAHDVVLFVHVVKSWSRG